MRAWSSRPVTVPGVQAREFTAEQLAGTTGRSNRRRRPNSTASARSTRSFVHERFVHERTWRARGRRLRVSFVSCCAWDLALTTSLRGGEDHNSESANALLTPVQDGATPDTRDSRRDSISSLAELETPLLEDALPLTRARTADPSFPSAVPLRTISDRPSVVALARKPLFKVYQRR